jgi:type 1 glutamine amidotransferase
MIASAQVPKKGAGRGRGGADALPPSVSVRPPDSRQIRGTVAGLLGWKVGVSAEALKAANFAEAAGKADALGLANIEGSSAQLDYNLPADELAKVKHRLGELRMSMPAYSVATVPADPTARRKLFEFAKALGVMTIVTTADASTAAELDKLANEFGVNVALPSTVALEGRSNRIGVSVDLEAPIAKGVAPAKALAPFKDRLMVVNLGDQAGRASQYLVEMVKLMPAPQEFPDKCSNCGRPTGELKPVMITVAPAAATIAAFEKAARPAMGYRVEQVTKILPITPVDKIPTDERQKIEAGVPTHALVKPKKVRKLLVIDLSPAGGYYHTTVAHANLALQLMAKTGAYEPIFSNDLNNLKWPKVKQYDAVFLNSVVGEVFPDPDVLNGLLRFVREGGGVAGVHGSTYASMDLPEFGELMGGQDGPHRVEPATLRVEDPASPLMNGFKGTDFPYVDEYYHFLPTGAYSREKLHVLLSINLEKSEPSPFNDIRPDHDYGLVWIKSYGKGRVFNCAMGHTPTLFATPALSEMMLGGIQFVLGDLEADTTPSAKLAAKK